MRATTSARAAAAVPALMAMIYIDLRVNCDFLQLFQVLMAII
jgi:hypothetical protein